VDVVLFQDFVSDIRRDFTAVLEPVDIHRFSSGYFGVEADELSGFDGSVLDGGQEGWRDQSSATLADFFHDEIGGAFGRSAAVLSHGGEDSGILHENLADDEHGFGAESVDLEL